MKYLSLLSFIIVFSSALLGQENSNWEDKIEPTVWQSVNNGEDVDVILYFDQLNLKEETAKMDTKIEKTFKYAKLQSSKHPTHDWHHTMRVWALAKKIASNETRKVNLEILELSVYLHDIARQEEDDSESSIDHALLGSKKARNLLERLKYPKHIIDVIEYFELIHRRIKATEKK